MTATNELGLFLRVRRESISPAEVGLPAGSRRRTPGLRRSEVATLAGVSVEYVTRLEQGRDRHPSPPVLDSLAEVLRLSPAERVRLHRLANAADPSFSCRGEAGPSRLVRPGVRALLDRLEPTSAMLVNHVGETLAWTSGWERLAGPIGLLDGDPPSLVRYVFTDPRARTALPDWNRVADEQVASLKLGPLQADAAVAALAAELAATAGEAFTRRVREVPGFPTPTGTLRLVHPALGELRLTFETLDLSADDAQRLIVHLPADAATTAALEGPRVPALRLVAG
ncbi:helix-turn-helix transcriptional regulator [Actinoplanes sp. NPDC049265]|uniref:helix-turn-helix transcriptional regulator n=1 Tax=Actinoplanes sp. NPDC049265 TaxID=3363902 RepID=UPI00371AD73A